MCVCVLLITAFLFIFSSCEKDIISADVPSDVPITTKQSLDSDLPNSMIFDNDNNGLDDKDNQVILEKKRPQDCCNCELLVFADRENFPLQTNNTWITQVFYEGCGGQTILQVGGQFNAPNGGNVYDTPGVTKRFPFVVEDGLSSMELRTLVGAFYTIGHPDNQLPINISTRVICERELSAQSGLTPLNLSMGCNSIPEFGTDGCGVFPPASQSGYVSDCAAIKSGF